MSFTPAQYNITLYQGADFSEALTWTDSTGIPVNLSGATWEAKARTDFTAISGANFTVSTVDVTGGIFKIFLPKETIATLPVGGTATQRTVTWGYWDCEVTMSGETSRILEGQVSISKEATK